MVCPKCKRAFPSTRSVCPVDGALLMASHEDTQGWGSATLQSPPQADGPLKSIQTDESSVESSATVAPYAGAEPAQVLTGAQVRTGPPGPQVTGPHTPAGVRRAPADPAIASRPQRTGPAQPAVDTELATGTMVGEYQVLGLLGTGGMGSVYSGVQPVIGKRVAIKVLLRELAANQQVVARFMGEARAVNQAQSRYIVDIFSFGELPDGRQYFVMEHLDGKSLRDFLKERQVLTFDEAYAILGCVAKGLIAAHSKGIIHRDIKPENIMVKVEEDGAITAKVLDFGIAKLQSGETSTPGFTTRTGAAMGTPYYMSPEQCRGVSVDHRTDLYAIGIIMFEMFTGALPFNARSYIDLVNKHLFASPPSPSRLRNAISPPLEALILRCIAKDPAERPQSAEQFLQELSQLAPALRGTRFNITAPEDAPREPEQVAIPGLAGPSPTTTAPPRAGSRWIALAAGLALITGLGVGAGFLYKRSLVRPSDGSGAGVGTAAPTTTLLSISTSPVGATIFLDDKKQAEPTPTQLEVKPGSHELRLQLAGYKTYVERVNTGAGQKHFLTYVLTAAPPESPARLHVSTGNPKASYTLDNEKVGSGSTLELSGLRAGPHRLRITAPGYLPVEQAVTLPAGAALELEIQLRSGKHVKKGGKDTKDAKGGDPPKKPDDDDTTINPFKKHSP